MALRDTGLYGFAQFRSHGDPVASLLDQYFDVTSRCLGKSEWANSANLILMLIDHLRDLVPAHPEPPIGHTGTLSASSTSACFTLFLDSR